jgi:hypothetical protein
MKTTVDADLGDHGPQSRKEDEFSSAPHRFLNFMTKCAKRSPRRVVVGVRRLMRPRAGDVARPATIIAPDDFVFAARLLSFRSPAHGEIHMHNSDVVDIDAHLSSCTKCGIHRVASVPETRDAQLPTPLILMCPRPVTLIVYFKPVG